jgi:hypothetical protein
VGVYIAAFVAHRVAPGEVPMVLILAASVGQASVVFSYCKSFLEGSPILRQEIDTVTATEIRLRNGVVLAVHANSFRSVRGRTLAAVVLDEVAYWRDESSATPDIEVYRACIPSLATTHGMMVGISSPYATKGLLFAKFQKSFGKNDAEVLVVRGATTVLNPCIDRTVIERAMEADPEAAKSEWSAEFRGDLQTYVNRDVVESCVDAGVHVRSFQLQHRYLAHADPSGGASDSFAIAISHVEGDRAILDCVEEWRPPFSPPEVVGEAVALLRKYRLHSVWGDQYASGWVSETFRQHGVIYKHSDLTRSEIFLAFLPLLTSQRAHLLDHSRLISQISNLERRVGRSGRDVIDHLRGQHDDVALVAAGSLVAAASEGAKLAVREAWKARQPARQMYANVGYSEIKRRHRDWGGAGQSRGSNEGLRPGSVPWPAPAADPFDNLYAPEFRGDGWKRI